MTIKDLNIRSALARAAMKEAWRQTISPEYDRFRYRILVILYSTAVICPLTLTIISIVRDNNELLFNYISVFFFMSLSLLYLIISKNIKAMIPAGIISAYAGFFCALFLPGGNGVHILIFLNFVPVIFLLTGSYNGTRWFVFFILSIIAVWVLNIAGIGPALKINLTHRKIATGIASLVVMFLIIRSGQLQYEMMMKRLVRSMTYDGITGLPVKEIFIRRMGAVHSSIIAIIHIVNFRKLSTLFGYDFSDRILLLVSDILREAGLESYFDVYKLAWHEFGLQIPSGENLTAAEAERILKTISDGVQNRCILWGDSNINLALCAGGVIVTDGDYEKALIHADTALATGLKLHRNVTIYDDSMDVKRDALDVLTRFTDLNNNIINGTLKSYLQPVVHTHNGDVCWYESLLRVKGGDGRYSSVYPYLTVARDTGLYHHLTDFMLSRAAEIISTTGLSISVNICLGDMLNSRVLEKVEAITRLENYSHGRLILEILESEDIENVEECIDFISAVKNMGVKIAIDDFGSGYSNFSNLLRMGVDIVKIDGALIRRLEHDRDAEVLINGIVDFCKNAERKIVAEFVENTRLLHKLRDLDVNYCQGYLFGEPCDSESSSV